MDDAVLETTDGITATCAEAPATVNAKSRDDAEALVLRVIASDADSLLRLARRHSLCADDAQDAYQRGLEIFMRHAARLDPDRAGAWLHTVVKHEAMAVRKSRALLVGMEDVDLDVHVSPHESPEDQVVRFDRVARSAEALQRLKPQEVRALWLKALGNSYEEIAAQEKWSYTKVNRCIAEGRKAFLRRYADIETGEECERFAPVLSAIVDGEATAQQVLDARPHLRNCPGCRATMREIREGTSSLASVFPAGALLVTDTPMTDGGGLLARLYEAVAGGIHDRALSSAVRLQATLDMASAGKVAAVAASAAAVTGGGVAAVERATAVPASRAAQVHAAPRPDLPRPAGESSRVVRPVAAATPLLHARTSRVNRQRAKRRTREFPARGASSAAEFAAAPAARTAATPARTPTPTSPTFERPAPAINAPAATHSSQEFSP